jgi:acetyl esterase/lipase
MRLAAKPVLAAMAPVLAAVALVAAGCGDDDSGPRPSSSFDVVEDVIYTEGLAADLFLVEEPDGKPTIVWVHGGGFTSGSKDNITDLAETFARRGYPGMAIDYRLSMGGPWFPATTLDDPALRLAASEAVEDATAAVDWLQSDDAHQRGIGTERVVVAGYSAGGITAIGAAAGGREPRIAAAISIAGAAVDPAALTSGTPPLLLLHGDQDDVVPIRLAQATCAAVAERSGECTLETFKGVGHYLPYDQIDQVESAVDAFLAGLQ